MDIEKLAEGFKLVLEGLGVDLADPHLKDTPRRTAEAWHDEICVGLREPKFSLEVFPLEEGQHPGLVVLNGIPVKSVCAHHLLPFFGTATVGFLPRKQLCGLSRLSRAVNHYARRPQLQEVLTSQIADLLQRELEPAGVGVVIQATHFCMEYRGVNHSGRFVTNALLGALRDEPAIRAEFLALAESGESSGRTE